MEGAAGGAVVRSWAKAVLGEPAEASVAAAVKPIVPRGGPVPDSHAGTVQGTGGGGAGNEGAAKKTGLTSLTVKGAEAVKEGAAGANPDRGSQPVKAGKGAGGDAPSGEKRAVVRLCSSFLNFDVFDFEFRSI